MDRSDYIFANREEEQHRLERQAEFFNPLTEHVFYAAELRSGMRVLDLGSGAGDVAMLAARLVGPDGEVVGVERDPAAVVAATARVERSGLSNIRFVQGDVQTLDGMQDGFDAVVGRPVLMYLPDPAAALVRATQLLRPDGLVCFQEGDMAYDWAAPMTPLWTQVRAWFLETLRRARVALRQPPRRSPSRRLSRRSAKRTPNIRLRRKTTSAAMAVLKLPTAECMQIRPRGHQPERLVPAVCSQAQVLTRFRKVLPTRAMRSPHEGTYGGHGEAPRGDPLGGFAVWDHLAGD
jgi:ubiquinone/menaquinone biosynthesis C-methylase UbiE